MPPEKPHDITFLSHQSLKASAKMAGILNKVYCMQSLSYVYVLFHVVNGIPLYTLSGVVNTANIEWSSFKWSLTRGQKQR